MQFLLVDLVVAVATWRRAFRGVPVAACCEDPARCSTMLQILDGALCSQSLTVPQQVDFACSQIVRQLLHFDLVKAPSQLSPLQ